MLVSTYRVLIAILLATGLLLNAFMVWKDQGLVRKGYPDFTIFYSAGKMVRAGLTRSLYDESVEFEVQRHFAPEVSIRHGALPYNHPPFEALLFVPFALLPYFPAYLAWVTVSILMLGLALAMLRPHAPLLKSRPLWLCLSCALAFFPIFICLLQGQDMLLFFVLLAAVYVFLRRGSDLLAGWCLGMGVFRPHLVLPIAIILLFSRRWRVALGAMYASVGVAVISLAVVGWRMFLDYPGYVWRLEKVMGRGSIVPDNMPNLRGFFAIFVRDGQPAALGLTAAGSALLLVLGIRLFRAAEYRGNLELGFSVAVLVAILIGYHTFFYDLGLLLLPMVLLAGEEPRRKPWALVIPELALWFTPLLMFIWLRLSHLNFLTPLLFLWLWAMASEAARLKDGRLESRMAAGSKPPIAPVPRA